MILIDNFHCFSSAELRVGKTWKRPQSPEEVNSVTADPNVVPVVEQNPFFTEPVSTSDAGQNINRPNFSRQKKKIKSRHSSAV